METSSKKDRPFRGLSFCLPVILCFLAALSTGACGQPAASSDTAALVGRWDIKVDIDGKTYPSWLEIRLSGFRTLVGRFVGIVGSARPVARIDFSQGKMSFSIPPQWEEEPEDLRVEGTFQEDSFTGIMTFSNGKQCRWTGTRAPVLRRPHQPVWGRPITLFDAATGLSKWHATGDNQWKAEAGVLKSPHSGSNLVTNEKFKDFKLHVEVRYPSESNSGIYLRGRYEVQVTDSKGMEPTEELFGAIYGFLPPSEMAAGAPGEWQTFDITLTGRMVTVAANGRTIICNREIPGITGGAVDSEEGEPGPVLLQGDHGPIEYRNIIITPAR